MELGKGGLYRLKPSCPATISTKTGRYGLPVVPRTPRGHFFSRGIVLARLFERGPDADLLREIFGYVVRRLIGTYAEGLVHADHGNPGLAHCPGRDGSCGGVFWIPARACAL